MKKTLICLAGPVGIAGVLVALWILFMGPFPVLCAMEIIGFALAVGTAMALTYPVLNRNRLAVRTVTLASILVFALVIVFVASAEEGFIHFFTRGWGEDGVSRSRYIYPDQSGTGYADGWRKLPLNLLKMSATGAVVGWIWGNILRLMPIWRTQGESVQQGGGHVR